MRYFPFSESFHIKKSFQFISDTERSIHGLQRQLETRERELDDERNKRRVLEKHFEKKTEKRLINDMAKRPAPQTVKKYHHFGAHF